MLRPIDLISREPGVERLSIPRWSLSHVNRLANEHLFHIEEAQQALQPLSARFRDHGSVLPLRCVEAVRLLQKLNGYVEELRGLFHETARLPLALLGLRYEALKHCYQITEKVDMLQDSITSYRYICMSSAHSPMRKEIFSAFQEMFQLISGTSQLLTELDEIARFQEKRLISIYEEASKP